MVNFFIKAINSTKLAVTFNKEVDKDTAENLDNYYIGITEADVDGSSIAKNNPDLYQAKRQDDKKTVIITAAEGKEEQVIWIDKHTKEIFETPEAVALKMNGTDSVEKDQQVFIQVRNVKDASGKLMDTQEASFKAVDTDPATLFGAELKDNKIVASKDNVSKHTVTSEEDVYFTFDEPVQIEGAEFYLDSRNITAHVELYDQDKSGKTIKVANEAGLKDLATGEYVFEAVGVHDLADNAVVGNVQTAILNVVDPSETTVEHKVPVVEAIKQTAEGTFDVIFNTAVQDGTKVVVKNAEGNVVGDGATTSGNAQTATVTFATELADYNNSTKLLYTVEVTGADGGKLVNADDSNVKGNKYSKVHEFTLDLVAPKVVMEVISEDENGKEVKTPTSFYDKATIVIPFADEPFNSDLIKGNPDKPIIIKQTVGEETITLTVPADNDNVTFENNEVTIDLVALAATDLTSADEATKKMVAAAKAFLNKDQDKLVDGKYEMSLPRGLVTDQAGADGKKLSDNDRTTPFVGDTVTFTVEHKEGDGNVSVPQTAQNLISYDEGHDAIIVKFVGEDIDAKTAKNPANYVLAGKALAANTKIEYQTLKDGDKVIGGEARIYLNEDTIARDGNYGLVVKNVATKGGAKMLPTSVTVDGMKDNTLPVLTSAVITGNAKIELTFSESVEVEDANKAAANFSVAVNGAKYNASTATLHDSNDKVIIVELNDTIEYAGKTVTVTTQADQNGDVFVTDKGLNKLKLNKMVTATVKGN